MRGFPRFFACTLAIVASGLGCRGRWSGGGGDAGTAVVAPLDKSPARPPPPLRVTHVAPPALPDLPALAAHDPPASAPNGTKLDEHPCGGVWSGSDLIPLVCTKSALLFGTGEGGAVVLVPDAQLRPTAPTLPAVVDHRVEGTEGPVRDQKNSPACTAFAMAAAIDHALLRWVGKAPQVSVMEIWSRYRAPTERTSISSNLGMSVGPESDWPFNVAEANGWMPCPLHAKSAARCGLPIDEAHRHKVEGHPVAQVTHVEYLTLPDTARMQEKLAAGQDIVITMMVPDSFVPKGRPGARYVPHYTKVGGDAGHAMLVSGYARLPHGTYFLLHNSWGPSWGDGGYAWIHEATVNEWAREALVLDAAPSSTAPGTRPARARGEETCAGDLVPDSIRGTCAPACPDGSPRHDGVCPGPVARAGTAPSNGQCPPGFVNLTGACALAAPSTTGTDAGTGISWTCGPGGCSYLVPRALDKACTGNACRISCPAPDFHVAKMNGVLTCIE